MRKRRTLLFSIIKSRKGFSLVREFPLEGAALKFLQLAESEAVWWLMINQGNKEKRQDLDGPASSLYCFFDAFSKTDRHGERESILLENP